MRLKSKSLGLKSVNVTSLRASKTAVSIKSRLQKAKGKILSQILNNSLLEKIKKETSETKKQIKDTV